MYGLQCYGDDDDDDDGTCQIYRLGSSSWRSVFADDDDDDSHSKIR